MEFQWLKGIQLYNLEEQFKKKFILKCPPEMIACNLNFRQTTNPEVGKYAMVIIPTLLQLPLTLSLDLTRTQAVSPMVPPPMKQITSPNSYMNSQCRIVGGHTIQSSAGILDLSQIITGQCQPFYLKLTCKITLGCVMTSILQICHKCQQMVSQVDYLCYGMKLVSMLQKGGFRNKRSTMWSRNILSEEAPQSVLEVIM